MENQLQQAKELRQNKKFKEAIDLYGPMYDDESIVFNNWDIWSYAHCLKKIGDLDKSIQITEEHIEFYPEFELLKNNLVWAYYDKYIRQFYPDDINNIESALNRIFDVNGQQVVDENNEIPCPFTLGVFKVLKHFKKPNFNSFKIRYWINKINPEKLSKLEQTIDQDGKKRELASDFENYYSYLIALLFEEKKYNDCIEAATYAIETIPKLHYSNTKWFKRKMALCYFELGKLDRAEEILKSLGSGNNDKWFIDHELSIIYFEQEDYDKALKCGIKAAKSFGEDSMKVKLYTHLARIFYKLDNLDYSKVHAELVIAIKQDNGQKLNFNQEKIVSFFSLNKESAINTRDQKRSVEKIWNSILFEGQEKHYGVITKILPNGKSGFILADNNKDSYFFSFRSIKGNKRFAEEGKKVSFYLKEGFDKKKNVKTMNATEIILIK